MPRTLKTNEIVGLCIGMVVTAGAIVIAVVLSGNYEDLGDRSLPFIYAPGAASLGIGAALAYVENKLVPSFAIDLAKGIRKLLLGIYRS